jgi:hypothetical protein
MTDCARTATRGSGSWAASRKASRIRSSAPEAPRRCRSAVIAVARSPASALCADTAINVSMPSTAGASPSICKARTRSSVEGAAEASRAAAVKSGGASGVSAIPASPASRACPPLVVSATTLPGAGFHESLPVKAVRAARASGVLPGSITNQVARKDAAKSDPSEMIDRGAMLLRSAPARNLHDHAVTGDVVLHAEVVRLAGGVEHATRGLSVKVVQRNDLHAGIGQKVRVVAVIEA